MYSIHSQERDHLLQVHRTLRPMYDDNRHHLEMFKYTTEHKLQFIPTGEIFYILATDKAPTVYHRGKPKCTYIHKGYTAFNDVEFSTGYFHITTEWRNTTTTGRDDAIPTQPRSRHKVYMKDEGGIYDQ